MTETTEFEAVFGQSDDGLSPDQKLDRMNMRIRVVAYMLRTWLNQRNEKQAALEVRVAALELIRIENGPARVRTLEDQQLGWKAQIALLVAVLGLAVTLVIKWPVYTEPRYSPPAPHITPSGGSR